MYICTRLCYMIQSTPCAESDKTWALQEQCSRTDTTKSFCNKSRSAAREFRV